MVVGAFEAVYRFLASLKLAVISLTTLAGVLAYATFFEKWYGTAAVQEWIYRSKGFAILLAFLGANILCAALIRYPWKKRQTGFVITHAGLLVLLAGSFYSVKTSDEGQVAALEGEVKDEIVRNDEPVVRVQQADPHDPASRSTSGNCRSAPGRSPGGPANPGRVRSVDTLLGPLRGRRRPESDRGLDASERPVPVRGQVAHPGIDRGSRACGRPARGANDQDPAQVQGARHAAGARRFCR